MNQTSTLTAISELHSEHSTVKLKEDAVFDGMKVPKGAPGTIVTVHPESSGYTVEFSYGRHTLLLDVLHDQVELDTAWPGQMSFMTTGSRPLGVRIVHAGERFTDIFGMHVHAHADPLIEFYAKGDPSQLISRYRWNTVEDYENVFHTVFPRRLGGSGIKLHAEYPGEMGGSPLDIEALLEAITKCRELLGPSNDELPFQRLDSKQDPVVVSLEQGN
jgi:hypothetical protein